MNMLRIKAAISLVSVLTLSGFNLICISTASAQEIHLEDQLIMFLPMTGNAADSSGMDVPTTLKGPELTNDRYDNPNSAYLFDGFDDGDLVVTAGISKIQDGQTVKLAQAEGALQ